MTGVLHGREEKGETWKKLGPNIQPNEVKRNKRECVVPENIHASPTLLPGQFSNHLPWGGYAYFVALHNRHFNNK